MSFLGTYYPKISEQAPGKFAERLMYMQRTNIVLLNPDDNNRRSSTRRSERIHTKNGPSQEVASGRVLDQEQTQADLRLWHAVRSNSGVHIHCFPDSGDGRPGKRKLQTQRSFWRGRGQRLLFTAARQNLGTVPLLRLCMRVCGCAYMCLRVCVCVCVCVWRSWSWTLLTTAGL